MRGGKMKWSSLVLREKHAKGALAGVDAERKNPLRGLFEHEGSRNKRLRLYLETGLSGERDVEPLLDRMAAARATRDTWLREVLDACED